MRHTVVQAVRDFLDNDGFTLCDSPIFTPAACEGTTTLFEVDYFDGEKAYLTQSGQLYNEATAAAFGKAYCFGPTFRAEKSKTRRHLTEFWMVEPEMAFATLDDVMALSERFLSYIAARVLEDRQEELKILERDTAKLEAIVPPFPRVHYDDAVKMLHEGFAKGALETQFEWGGDFGAPDETYISSQFDKPVMVHHYPAEVKAFYMARDPERNELALGVDVLAPEGYGEVIGGGERATSLEFLKEQIALASTSRRKLSVVPGFATLWQRPSRRFWHGHRTLHGVDVRHRAYTRNDSVSAHALSNSTVATVALPMAVADC